MHKHDAQARILWTSEIIALLVFFPDLAANGLSLVNVWETDLEPWIITDYIIR